MPKLLLPGLLIAAALLPASPAAAHEGPWCMKANMGRSVTERCHFTTFEACNAERSLNGTTAFCSQNPRYLPYWQGRGFGEEPRRKLSRKTKHRRHPS
jgi:hypothetical protein